ncbi:hypothetical protein [Fluviicola sp.]
MTGDFSFTAHNFIECFEFEIRCRRYSVFVFVLSCWILCLMISQST